MPVQLLQAQLLMAGVCLVFNHVSFLLCRVDGVKRVSHVAVGEKHSLALQSWSQAPQQLVLPAMAEAAAIAAESAPLGAAEEDRASLEQGEDASWTAAVDRAASGGVSRPSSRNGRHDSLQLQWPGQPYWDALEKAHATVQQAELADLDPDM